MRCDAPFVVKHLAPIMDRPDRPRRASVAYQAYSVADALHWARPGSPARGPVWIERRGAPATLALKFRKALTFRKGNS
jgi:hypothetical protein